MLLIGNRNLIAETDVGEVVVYNVRDKDIPIVHRVVRKFGTGYEHLGNDVGGWQKVQTITRDGSS